MVQTSLWARASSAQGIHLQKPAISLLRGAHLRRTVLCASEEATEHVGHIIGSSVKPGTVVLLKGGLGVGKTVFARGFLRGAMGASHAAVTSPTFLLDNVYSTREGVLIHHMDLYRLREPGDAASLNLKRVFTTDISIVEWPQRLVGEQDAPLDAPLEASQAVPEGSSNNALPTEYLLVHLVTEAEPEFSMAASNAQSSTSPAPPSSTQLLDSIMNGNGHGHRPVDLSADSSKPASTPTSAPSASGRPAGATGVTAHASGFLDVLEDTQARAALFYARGPKYEALLESVDAELRSPLPPSHQLK